MATPLTENTVQSTYDALIKIGDNQPISASLKVLSDGLGTELPIQISTSTLKVTGTLDTTTGVINVAAPTADSNATTKLYVDTEIADVTTAYEAADSGLQTQINTNASDITDLQNVDATIFGWTLDGLNLSDSIDIQGANGITVSNNGNNVITIDGSAIQADVDANTSDITALENAVSSISTDVATNTTNIAINAANIASNDTDIAANASAITDLENGVGNVTSFNTLTGDVTISAGTNISFNTVGQNIEISSTGGGGGSDSFNTFTVPTQPDVVADSGNDTMNFVDGAGISMTTNNTTKTITFNVDGLGNTALPQNNIWVGDASGVPQAVLRDNAYVGFANNALNVELATAVTGDYGLVLHQGGPGATEQLYADSDGNVPTWSASTNALTMANANVTGNLQAGAITDVEQAIDDVESDITTLQSDVSTAQSNITTLQGDVSQNTSDIAALQAIPQYAPVVTETASFIIEDNTYEGKFVVCNSSSVIEVELEDSATYPANVGDEIYFMQQGTGQVQIISLGSTTLQAPGNLSKTRTQYSTIGIKYLGSNVWVAMGDLGV